MKKMLVFLLVVGVLMLGNVALAEEPSALHEQKEGSENNIDSPADENSTPCGGGSGSGPGGAPG